MPGDRGSTGTAMAAASLAAPSGPEVTIRSIGVTLTFAAGP